MDLKEQFNMQHLDNYLFWFSSKDKCWYAIPRTEIDAFFMGNKQVAISATAIATLIEKLRI